MNQTIQETIKDTDEPVTVKGFRSASGETPNLGLPIVSGTDVYSPLTDWNQSMEKIDSAVGLVELMGSVNKIEIEKIKADNTRQDAELDAIRQVDGTQTEWLIDQQGSINKLKVSNDTIEKDIIEQNALIKNLTNRVLEVEDKLDPDSGEVAAEIEANTAKIEANTALISDLTNRVVETEDKLDPDSGEVAAKIEANTAEIRDHWQGDETVQPNGILNNAKLTRGFASLSGRGGLPIVKTVPRTSPDLIIATIPIDELYPPAGTPTGRPNLFLIEIFFKVNGPVPNLGEMYGSTVVDENKLPAIITTKDLASATNVTIPFSVNLDGKNIKIRSQNNSEIDAVCIRLQALSFLQS